MELVHVLAQDAGRRIVRLLDHTADLIIDLARDLLRIIRRRAHVATKERHVVVAAEHTRAELLAHAEAHDHLLRRVRDFLEIVRRTGRDLVEHELFRRATAERHRHLIHQRALRRQVPILSRQRDRVPERLATADDRDLVHVIRTLEVVADERMPHLVVGGDLPLRLREQARLLLGTGDHAHDPLLELALADRLLAPTRREQGRLVDHVGEIGARESGRLCSEDVKIELLGKGLAL